MDTSPFIKKTIEQLFIQNGFSKEDFLLKIINTKFVEKNTYNLISRIKSSQPPIFHSVIGNNLAELFNCMLDEKDKKISFFNQENINDINTKKYLFIQQYNEKYYFDNHTYSPFVHEVIEDHLDIILKTTTNPLDILDKLFAIKIDLTKNIPYELD